MCQGKKTVGNRKMFAGSEAKQSFIIDPHAELH